jgi:hypothetical protein
MTAPHIPAAVIQWLHSTHDEMIVKIAKRETKDIRTVEVEDVIQTVREGFYSRAKGTDFTLWERNGIADLATKMAREYVGRERIDYMHFSCNYLYTPAMVEQYLRESLWCEVEDAPDIDGRVDVKREFDKLPRQHRVALFLKYGVGETFPQNDPKRYLSSTGVDRITNGLNISAKMRRVELSDVE